MEKHFNMSTGCVPGSCNGNLEIRLMSLNGKGRLFRSEDLEGPAANVWARIHYFLVPLCCYFYHTKHFISLPCWEQTFTNSGYRGKVLCGKEARFIPEMFVGFFPNMKLFYTFLFNNKPPQSLDIYS